MKQAIYLIPGLGANSKIFERIYLDPTKYNCIYLEWLIPLSNESFDSYINRFASLIKEPNPIFIGVSFGGIIAQELAKKIPYKKIFVISSIKSKQEYSPQMKFFKKWKAYKFFPSKSIHFLLKHANIFPKKSLLAKKIKMYNTYLTQRNPYYLDWCMKMAINWNNEQPLPHTIHIHGTKDHIFPIKYIKDNVIKIKNGTHAMVLINAKEVSKIINQHLID